MPGMVSPSHRYRPPGPACADNRRHWKYLRPIDPPAQQRTALLRDPRALRPKRQARGVDVPGCRGATHQSLWQMPIGVDRPALCGDSDE